MGLPTPRGISRDQTSLLSGSAWPPDNQIRWPVGPAPPITTFSRDQADRVYVGVRLWSDQIEAQVVQQNGVGAPGIFPGDTPSSLLHTRKEWTRGDNQVVRCRGARGAVTALMGQYVSWSRESGDVTARSLLADSDTSTLEIAQCPRPTKPAWSAVAAWAAP